MVDAEGDAGEGVVSVPPRLGNVTISLGTPDAGGG